MSRVNSGYDDDSDDDEPIQSSEQFKDKHDHCTDLPCCCLWICCLLAFLGVIGYGMKHGNMNRLHHGIDLNGNVCGVDVGVELKPYTYFCPPSIWDLAAAAANGTTVTEAFAMSNAVCVAACPVKGATGIIEPAVVAECNATTMLQTAYETTNELNYCIPAVASPAMEKVKEGVVGAMSGFVPSIMHAADTLYKGLPLYFSAFFLSILLGYAYLFCLQTFARPMVYLAILISFITLCILGGILIYQAPTIGNNGVMAENFGQFASGMAYVIGVLSLGGAFGLACFMCCCHSQVEYAVVAVQMTTDVMWHIPSLLFAPVIKAVIKFVVALVLLVFFVHLLAIAHPKAIAGSAYAREFKYEDFEWLLIWYYVFMYGWIMAFLTAVYQFSVAYATADYFYAQAVDYSPDDRDVAPCNFLEGMIAGLMWHQGSLAFGSFIIAIFSLIQRVIEYLERTSPDNPVTKIIACLCMCCVTMCKSCAEFINKNAYIAIAIKGFNFCSAARNAFKVMVENAAGMAILNGATWVFQIAGLLLITSIVMFLTDAICNLNTFKEPTSSWFLPNPTVAVVVAGLIAFAMAKVFMDVFDMVSDTLMFCLGLEGFNKMSNKVPESVRGAMTEAESMKRDGA